jgi:hypothetical protein
MAGLCAAAHRSSVMQCAGGWGGRPWVDLEQVAESVVAPRSLWVRPAAAHGYDVPRRWRPRVLADDALHSARRRRRRGSGRRHTFVTTAYFSSAQVDKTSRSDRGSAANLRAMPLLLFPFKFWPFYKTVVLSWMRYSDTIRYTLRIDMRLVSAIG